jgi:hypothetical protein
MEYLQIGDRQAHLDLDIDGTYSTHELFGSWATVDEIAGLLILFHPDFSPLASREQPA